MGIAYYHNLNLKKKTKVPILIQSRLVFYQVPIFSYLLGYILVADELFRSI